MGEPTGRTAPSLPRDTRIALYVPTLAGELVCRGYSVDFVLNRGRLARSDLAGAQLIPHAVPADLVYLFGRGPVGTVYGDIGTALITATWILAETPAISLMRSLDINDDKLNMLFDSLDIKMR